MSTIFNLADFFVEDLVKEIVNLIYTHAQGPYLV